MKVERRGIAAHRLQLRQHERRHNSTKQRAAAAMAPPAPSSKMLTEQRLREANEKLVLATFGAQDLLHEAEQAIVHQQDFLAMLAHELRNPLAPITMATDMLGKLSGAAQLPQLLSIIRRQTGQLARLVDDLLDASRIQSGKIALDRQPRQLAEILDNAIETALPHILARRQHITVGPVDAGIVVLGDRLRLAQAFCNLLINASKFTHEGGHLSLTAQRLSDQVRVEVADNGSGIEADIQPYIFDLFRQGASAGIEGGLGIGLSLVRSIVELHDGKVSVASAGNSHGSTFTVDLPCADDGAAVAAARHAVLAAAGPAPRVLLVELNNDASATMQLLLERQGHQVMPAFDQPTALAMMERSPYDAVVCHVGPHGVADDAIVDQLRHHALNPRTRYIAISSYGRIDDRDSALRAGFEHYLVTPFRIDRLLSLISRPAMNSSV